MNIIDQLQRKNFVLCSALIHQPEELEQYLYNKVNILTVIAIATPYSKNVSSQCRFYKHGKLVRKFSLPSMKIFPFALHFRIFLIPLSYSLQFISIIYSILRLRKKFDIYLGVGYFYALIGIILHRMRFVDKVIYYNQDYFPLPCRIGIYTLFNRIAQIIDRFCANRCNIIWNLSPALVEIKRQQIITPKDSPQIVVPLGIDGGRIYQRPLNEIDTASIGFIGVIGIHQGLDLLLEVLPEIKEKVSNVKLNIIGSGPHEKKIKNIVQEKGLGKSVIFWGFISDEAKVKEILSNCAIAVAPYIPSIDSPTQYADPGKIKKYMAFGLPIVITKVPLIAFEIDSRRAGFAIEYNKNEIVVAILKLLSDRELLKEYRENILKLALEYRWETILNKAWSKSWCYLAGEEYTNP